MCADCLPRIADCHAVHHRPDLELGSRQVTGFVTLTADPTKEPLMTMFPTEPHGSVTTRRSRRCSGFLASARVLLAVSLLSPALARDSLAQGEVDRMRLTANGASCQPRDSRVPVLIVGTYHMANPGLDQFNLKADDILSPRRQREVAAVAEALARFQPTHVAVEWPATDSAFAGRYSAYREGKLTLTANEVDQLGFRIAKLAGLARVDAIDFNLGLEAGSLEPFVRSNPDHARRMQRLQVFGGEAVTIMGEWLGSGTVAQMLSRMNTRETLYLTHLPYLHYMLPVGDPGNNAGAEVVAQWYRRNLHIFANLFRLTTTGSRVLVLYGQGHVPLLRDFAAK